MLVSKRYLRKCEEEAKEGAEWRRKYFDVKNELDELKVQVNRIPIGESESLQLIECAETYAESFNYEITAISGEVYVVEYMVLDSFEDSFNGEILKQRATRIIVRDKLATKTIDTWFRRGEYPAVVDICDFFRSVFLFEGEE